MKKRTQPYNLALAHGPVSRSPTYKRVTGRRVNLNFIHSPLAANEWKQGRITKTWPAVAQLSEVAIPSPCFHHHRLDGEFRYRSYSRNTEARHGFRLFSTKGHRGRKIRQINGRIISSSKIQRST